MFPLPSWIPMSYSFVILVVVFPWPPCCATIWRFSPFPPGASRFSAMCRSECSVQIGDLLVNQVRWSKQCVVVHSSAILKMGLLQCVLLVYGSFSPAYLGFKTVFQFQRIPYISTSTKLPTAVMTPFLCLTTVPAFNFYVATRYCPSVELKAMDGPNVCVFVDVLGVIGVVDGRSLDEADWSAGYSHSPYSSASKSFTWRRTHLPRKRKRISQCTLPR
jgi:hypothetical protein